MLELRIKCRRFQNSSDWLKASQSGQKKGKLKLRFDQIWCCVFLTYLSMKDGSLFCFVIMKSTEPGCFRLCCWCLWKALDEEGCMGLVPCLDLWCKSSCWMIFYLKIELNRSFNFWRNWNVPLMLLERSWWAGFNGIYLVRFGFRMWYILILKWFLPLKIQINSKNPSFERKNQLRTW